MGKILIFVGLAIALIAWFVWLFTGLTHDPKLARRCTAAGCFGLVVALFGAFL